MKAGMGVSQCDFETTRQLHLRTCPQVGSRQHPRFRGRSQSGAAEHYFVAWHRYPRSRFYKLVLAQGHYLGAVRWRLQRVLALGKSCKQVRSAKQIHTLTTSTRS